MTLSDAHDSPPAAPVARDHLAKVWADVSGLELDGLEAAATSWIKTEVPNSEAGPGGPVGGMSLAMALHLVTGAAILSSLEELAPLNGAVSSLEVRAALSRLFITSSITSSWTCGGVVKASGICCKSACTEGLSTCARHKAQDVVSCVLAVLGCFPRFPSGQSLVFSGGICPEGNVALCTLCLRARLLSDATEECGSLGEPDSESVFSHWPTWMEDVGASFLDRPGAQFCLHCAATAPAACQLLRWVMHSSDGLAARDGDVAPTLGSRSLWVWCPSGQLVSPQRIVFLQDFARRNSVGMPAAWAVMATAATPGAARAVVMRSAIARAKEGSGTANRAALHDAVQRGRGLAVEFEMAEEPPARRQAQEPESRQERLRAALETGQDPPSWPRSSNG